MSAAAAVAPATVSATAYGQQRSPAAQPRASGARRGAGRVGWGGGRGAAVAERVQGGAGRGEAG